MEKIYFKNDYKGGTPIPKVLYWYLCESGYKKSINAEICNKLYNNELKQFFEEYPDELNNACLFINLFPLKTNITNADINFYKGKIKLTKEDK